MRHRFFVHARAAVGDTHHNVGARTRVGISGTVLGNFDVARAEPELAALRHRIPRVDAQIENRALELRGIEPHRMERRIEMHIKLDRFAEGALQQIAKIGEKVIGIDGFRLNHLLARKSEQLLRELAAAACRLQGRARKPLDPAGVAGVA